MSTPSGSTPSDASATNVSTVSVAGSFPNSTQTRSGANQPNSYNINRYVYNTQERPVNDRLAQYMAIYAQENPPKGK
ncbi:uncharacterized protein BKA55DRAFT_578563 [Fusarium redolens]|uniref:Uncharacterized protein n=1 Tax=Fusarium redolens TaxID=48865 RepID=A0A9P9GDY8_FUSRE|nr:uncharacterized protein BKA55DRAFT_578563 [Fusarium redolens]KAH7236795.1 hypothetical protein BKA55DRAFT_578563 [Fusarium redolens]